MNSEIDELERLSTQKPSTLSSAFSPEPSTISPTISFMAKYLEDNI